MDLVDEQDDLAIRALHLELQTAHSLGERPTDARTGYEATSGELDDDGAFEAAHSSSAFRESTGEPFDDGRLPDARRTYENRVVGPTACQNVEEPLDLVVATDDVVDASERCHLGKVAPELRQRRISTGVQAEGRCRDDQLVLFDDRPPFDRRFDERLFGVFFRRVDAQLDQRRRIRGTPGRRACGFRRRRVLRRRGWTYVRRSDTWRFSIDRLQRASNRFLNTLRTSADLFETSVGRASRVTRNGKEEVCGQHLGGLHRLGDSIRSLDGAFKRAHRFGIDHSDRAQQVTFLHPESRQQLPHRAAGLQHHQK